jgi:hypothetical protein
MKRREPVRRLPTEDEVRHYMNAPRRPVVHVPPRFERIGRYGKRAGTE